MYVYLFRDVVLFWSGEDTVVVGQISCLFWYPAIRTPHQISKFQDQQNHKKEIRQINKKETFSCRTNKGNTEQAIGLTVLISGGQSENRIPLIILPAGGLSHIINNCAVQPPGRGRGGYFGNLWVGMCCWDPGTLNLCQSQFSCILLPYTRVNSLNPPYPRVAVLQKLLRSLARSSQNKTLYHSPQSG